MHYLVNIKMNSFTKLFLSFTLVFLISACSMKNTEQERFIEIFDGEVQNRAFALEYTQRSAESWNDADVRAFWAAYYELEVLNQDIYKPYADKYDLEMASRTMTSLKTSGLRLMSNLFPNYMLSTIYESTVEYIKGLKEMEKLAPEEDKAFFRYIVIQEEVQIKALALVAKGKAKEGTIVLTDYLTTKPSVE